MNPTIFDLKHCPLDGSNLLEAGAGTGKTYSLAYLYLRLLLEKGLRVEEILVTTFTVAATAELKGRIFDVLSEAERTFAMLCQNEEATAHGDAFLIEVLTHSRTHHDDTLIQQRLRLALAQFDAVQIFTINGFALHLLREHSDVLGIYHPENILNDDSEFVEKAYVALARDNFSDLGEQAANIGHAVAGFDTKTLFHLLTNMLRYRDYIDAGNAQLFERAEQLTALQQQALACHHQSAVQLLADAIEQGGQLNRNSYKPEKLQAYASRLTDIAAYADADLIKFFSQSYLTEKRNKKATVILDHPLFTLCDRLCEQADDLGMLEKLVDYRALLCLLDALQQRVADLKAEQMALTHDDIVSRVAAGASTIRTSLKAALIDEAQDTNSHQMKLFKQLFLCREDAPTVFFVGDPKQAIYGFRGANVYSYLDIEKAVQRHYIMDTNYRSTNALNDSINTFFSTPDVFLSGGKIAYHAIHWQVDNSVSGFGDKSLTLMVAPAGDKNTLAQTAADSLSALLQQGILIPDSATTSRPLTPRDIAVLVRSRDQAITVKQALASNGVSSSFTGKLSLYESDEAKLLLALLSAVDSGDVRVVKSLMLTPLFGYRLEDMDNHSLVMQVRTDLHHFANSYTQAGFSVMFYRLLKHFSLAGRLLQSHDGKRRLTNFIQLFERLQNVLQRQSLSLSGLREHLATAIHDADSDSELRLEDTSAVTIMTMHTAKGLEFPVVCLPFFEYDANNNRSDGLLVSHQRRSAAPAFLNPADLKQWVAAEALAEQRRLAYVALTRAKYHNVIIRQPENSNYYKKQSMLMALLGDSPERITEAGFVADNLIIDAIAGARSLDNPPTYRAKQLDKPLYSAWQLQSFSRLQQQAAAQAIPTSHMDNPDNLAASPKTGDEPADSTNLDSALMAYPAGPRPGTALHEMYEHFLSHRQNDTLFHQAIATSISRHLFAKDQATCPSTAALADAIVETTAIALAPNDFCLQDVALEKQSIEMKFFLHLSPAARQQLLSYFEQAPDTPLSPKIDALIPTEGYVHGYIDFLFEQDGKYYVLDYKSNRLGETAADFGRANMHAEMQHHRYDLQALIYTLALCKHLGIRTESEYEETIGGYYYLFVRGMQRGRTAGIYADKVPWSRLVGLVNE